jgi:CheY-like chemotaxis protein
MLQQPFLLPERGTEERRRRMQLDPGGVMIRRMLIVEDERDIADCLQEFFKMRGFSVASAFSGEQALELLQRDSADVILLDILLPGLSGIEVLKRVKALHPRAQVIMVTALDRDDLRIEAHRYGASGYVTKPFDFSPNTWSVVLTGPTSNLPQSYPFGT